MQIYKFFVLREKSLIEFVHVSNNNIVEELEELVSDGSYKGGVKDSMANSGLFLYDSSLSIYHKSSIIHKKPPQYRIRP